MTSWVITLPQKIEWGDYEKELEAVADGASVMNYRVANAPKALEEGDRCYTVWRGKVRGWMKVTGVRKSKEAWTCTTTGREWPAGAYVLRSGPFNPTDGPPMKGFQGIRKYTEASVLASMLADAGYDELAEVVAAPKGLTIIDPNNPVYGMELRNDRFVHFLPQNRVLEVARSGKLLMDPPYPKFGPHAIYAISAVWGSFVPGTQTKHIKGKVAAISFKTPTKPKYGYPEEVVWGKDVVLKDVRILKEGEAKRLLAKTPENPGVEDFVVEYV